MKILFDLRATQPNASGKRHGGGRYGEAIFFKMVERNIFIICFYDSRLWLNPDVRTVIEQHNIPLFDCSKQSLQNIVDEQKVDRVYSCLLREDVAYLKGCEVYATQHGLRTQETPFDKCFWDYNNPFMMKIKFAIKSLFQKSYRKYIDRKHFNVYVVTSKNHIFCQKLF